MISHLLYADDILVTYKENPENAKVVEKCLELCSTWSGHQANSDKFSLLFSPKRDVKAKRSINTIMGFKTMKKDSFYLGNVLISGRNKPNDYNHIKERVYNRLESWQETLLSKASKVTLIKLVVQTIQFTLCLPSVCLEKICKELNSMACHFLDC